MHINALARHTLINAGRVLEKTVYTFQKPASQRRLHPHISEIVLLSDDFVFF